MIIQEYKAGQNILAMDALPDPSKKPIKYDLYMQEAHPRRCGLFSFLNVRRRPSLFAATVLWYRICPERAIIICDL